MAARNAGAGLGDRLAARNRSTDGCWGDGPPPTSSGVVMQEQQSSVGKTLLSVIILPPMLGSRSTSATWKALVGQVERGLHPGNPAADDEGIPTDSKFFSLCSRGAISSSWTKPMPPAGRPSAVTSFRNGLTHTVQMAARRRRRMSIAARLHQGIGAVDERGRAVRFDLVRAVGAAVHDDDAVDAALEGAHEELRRKHDRAHRPAGCRCWPGTRHAPVRSSRPRRSRPPGSPGSGSSGLSRLLGRGHGVSACLAVNRLTSRGG